HRGADARAEAALARRFAVTARIPREDGEVGQVELVGKMRHAARMLVPAMKDDDGAARRLGRRPEAIEEIDAVMRPERAFLGSAPRTPVRMARARDCRPPRRARCGRDWRS